MSRTSTDQFINGILFNGYDYKNQAWVREGIYQRCGHPEGMDCGCYGKTHQGEKCTLPINYTWPILELRGKS